MILLNVTSDDMCCCVPSCSHWLFRNWTSKGVSGGEPHASSLPMMDGAVAMLVIRGGDRFDLTDTKSIIIDSCGSSVWKELGQYMFSASTTVIILWLSEHWPRQMTAFTANVVKTVWGIDEEAWSNKWLIKLDETGSQLEPALDPHHYLLQPQKSDNDTCNGPKAMWKTRKFLFFNCTRNILKLISFNNHSY